MVKFDRESTGEISKDIGMDDAPCARVFTGKVYAHGTASGWLTASDLELSFWGGVDSQSGEVIDRHHPLSGRYLAGSILAIPAGRGSCSGSGVMLELLLNGKGPKALIFERDEDILTLGVVIADEMFGRSIPVVRLSSADFLQVLDGGYVHINGDEVVCLGSETVCVLDGGEPAEIGDAFASIALTENDRSCLAGASGEAAQLAMRIILRMAALQGVGQLMDIAQVHIDGCIYIGPSSLAFAEKFRDFGGKVKVPTTLNSISVDRRRWREQGVAPELGRPASALADAYVAMGAQPTFTCAPYLLETAPTRGEQVAWAESNAVVFANSVLGARTMKYPDFLDLCTAITGRAPFAGCHVESNRKANIHINVALGKAVDDALYPLLGYHVGALAGNNIPVLTGLADACPTRDDLKAFSAAFATTSSAPMFHILGVTPEAAVFEDVISSDFTSEVLDVVPDHLVDCWKQLNSARTDRVDLVSLGNPHFSFEELSTLAALCKGKTRDPGVTLVVTCGRAIWERAEETGLVAELERFGVQFVTDTCWCMITEPLIPTDADVIMTNSGKYAHYGPGITGRKFHFGSLAECVDAACHGVRRMVEPAWMKRKR